MYFDLIIYFNYDLRFLIVRFLWKLDILRIDKNLIVVYYYSF